jgi:hypothetical protein
MDIKQVWSDRKAWIIAVVVAFIVGGMLCQSAQAQECTPGEGDGPVDQTKSAVKKMDDQVTISWTAPEFLQDCTRIDSDPALALTGYSVRISLDAPVTSDLPTIDVPATQTSLTVRVDSTSGVKPGSRLYYSIASTNDFGTGPMSNQPWVQVGGPPGRAGASAL